MAVVSNSSDDLVEVFGIMVPRNPQEANPHRAGACTECGSYRTDGRPPYIHRDDCPREGDLQLGRWSTEQQAGDHGGPVLYCTEHDHAVKRQQAQRGAAKA
jgi:hypothetical protein